jgi:hypothetical protein
LVGIQLDPTCGNYSNPSQDLVLIDFKLYPKPKSSKVKTMIGTRLSRTKSRESRFSNIHNGNPKNFTSSEKIMRKGENVTLSPSENIVDLTCDQYHILWCYDPTP